LERVFLGRHKACATLCLEKKVYPLTAASPPRLLASGQDLSSLLSRSFRELSMGQNLVMRVEEWFGQAKAFGKEQDRPQLLAPEGAIPFRLPLSPVIQSETVIASTGRVWSPVRDSLPTVSAEGQPDDLASDFVANADRRDEEPQEGGDSAPRPSEKSWEEISGEIPLEDMRWETVDQGLKDSPEGFDASGGSDLPPISTSESPQEPDDDSEADDAPNALENKEGDEKSAAKEPEKKSEKNVQDRSQASSQDQSQESSQGRSQEGPQNPSQDDSDEDRPEGARSKILSEAESADVWKQAGHTLILSPTLDEDRIIPFSELSEKESGQHTLFMPPDLDSANAPPLQLGEPMPVAPVPPAEEPAAPAAEPEDPFAAFKAKIKAQEEAMRYAEETEQAELSVQEDRIQEWKKGLQETQSQPEASAPEPEMEPPPPTQTPVFGAATWAQDQVATMYMPGEGDSESPPTKRGMPYFNLDSPDAALHTLAISREELLGTPYPNTQLSEKASEKNSDKPADKSAESEARSHPKSKRPKPQVPSPSLEWETAPPAVIPFSSTRATTPSALTPESLSAQPLAPVPGPISYPHGSREPTPVETAAPIPYAPPVPAPASSSPSNPTSTSATTPAPTSEHSQEVRPASPAGPYVSASVKTGKKLPPVKAPSISPPLPKGLEDTNFSPEEFAPMWPEPARVRWIKPLLYALIFVGGFSMLFGLAVMTGLWERINRPPQTIWEPNPVQIPTAQEIASDMRETVSRSLRRDRPALEALYAKHSKTKKGLSGEVQISLEVQPHGGVTQSFIRSSNTATPNFEKAVARLLSQWTFASFPTQSPKWVTVKLNFPLAK
jgi:hypothetical protein